MKHLKIVALAAACLAAAPASATALNFTVTGSAEARFTLDSNPTPSRVSPNAGFPAIFFDAQTVNFGGVNGLWTITFLRNNSLTFIIGSPTSGTVLEAGGAELYTGSDTAPTLLPGTYHLTRGSNAYTVEVAAVPEPATWAMMIGGFGLAGTALRRRRKSVAYA